MVPSASVARQQSSNSPGWVAFHTKSNGVHANGDAGSPILLRTKSGYRIVGLQTLVTSTRNGAVPAALVVGQAHDLPVGPSAVR